MQATLAKRDLSVRGSVQQKLESCYSQPKHSEGAKDGNAHLPRRFGEELRAKRLSDGIERVARLGQSPENASDIDSTFRGRIRIRDASSG
jgi:hypothetical protein